MKGTAVLAVAALGLAACTSISRTPGPPVGESGLEEGPARYLVPTVYVDEDNPNSACSRSGQRMSDDAGPGHTCIEILFGTDRSFSADADVASLGVAAYPENPADFFEDKRFGGGPSVAAQPFFRPVIGDADRTRLPYESYRVGRMVVTVPARNRGDMIRPFNYHRLGEGTLGRTSRTPTDRDLEKYFTSFAYEVMRQDDFWGRAQALLGRADDMGNPEWADDSRSVLVFVHGYNVSLASAAYRTAQIAYDLRYAGVPFTFSWPANSQHDVLRYFNDTSEAAGAVGDLKLFLLDIKEKLNPDKFIIIAHSHGNQLLLRTLNEIAAEQRDPEAVFDVIVYASPDVDAFEFRRLVERSSHLAQVKTLYTSSDDKANLARQILSGLRRNLFRSIEVKHRAGYVPPGEPPVLAAGLQSIDITRSHMGVLQPEQATRRLGSARRDGMLHDQYVSSGEILTDLRRLISRPVDESGAPVRPECRIPLLRTMVVSGRGEYWRYDPSGVGATGC